MKFIDLKKSDINRNETYKKFEEALKKFKNGYENNFELDYYSTDELIITVYDPKEYNEKLHEDLCETFDVRLQCVYKSDIQTPKKHSNKIEFIYAPVHHYITYLEWGDINL